MSVSHRGRRDRPAGRVVRRVVAGPALVAILAGLLTGCGGSRAHGASAGSSTGIDTTTRSGGGTAAAGSLAVSTAHPTTRASIAFAYSVPAATGVHGTVRISYSVSITGPHGSGCVGAHEASGPSATAGQRVSITVGPGRLGHPWCPGAYTARVFELQRAACTSTAPCPQYIRVVGVVARARFAVTTS